MGGGLEIINGNRKGVLLKSGAYDTVLWTRLFYLQQCNDQKTRLNSFFVINMV